MQRRIMVAAALSAVLLSGCGGSEDDSPTAVDPKDGSDTTVGELAAHDGQPCPDQLPQPAEGLGTDQPAASAPTLPAVDQAWVCQYAANEANKWLLEGEANPVDAALLPDIETGLGALSPAPAHQMCTMDLGPRWMIVSATADGDLTGVVVDDFGCRSVRLTDEPFEVVPGEGTFPGALSAPDGLLEKIKAAVGA
jgi:hypothetical protein